MDASTKARILSNKTNALRIRLNKFDVCSFNRVPQHIVNAFYGEGTYRSRLIVTTFAFCNGFSSEVLFEMLQWKPLKKDDITKIHSLFEYLKDPEVSWKYYTYGTYEEKMVYCNGDLRIGGERIRCQHEMRNW